MIDELCPDAPPGEEVHCQHWYECEPCCWCHDDTPDPDCDCPRRTAERGQQ